MTSPRADHHDIDKLGRWRGDLSGDTAGEFPVYAVFLVDAGDRVAHDIFRQYRTSFEARGAGFAHLVIFGQHGRSSAVQRLLAEWSLPQNAAPALVLLPVADPATGRWLALPRGATPGPDQHRDPSLWRETLRRVEAVVDGQQPADNLFADFPAGPGVATLPRRNGPLLELLDRVLELLGGNAGLG